MIYLENPNDSSGYQQPQFRLSAISGSGGWSTPSSPTMLRSDMLMSPSTAPRRCRTSMKTMVPGEPSNYFKMGVYRDPVNTSTAVLYYDNFSISK